MLLTLPLWTWLVACGLVGVTVVGYPVPADGGCVLRKNSGPDQIIGLGMLTDLFGETLMTESNNKTYYVSICRRIPLYGSTSLAGAVRLNSKGEYVVLGEINQAEVVVNEKTIVLTYTGSDVNINLHEECLGNKWKTYLTLICDPYATEDTLKLVDEDPNQPEICRIKFEIPTSKICRRSSSVVRAPIVQDKSNNLPLVINGSHINQNQYNDNNKSTNNNIVSDVDENNLNNYRHYGFVNFQVNSKQQNLHQDDTNNYNKIMNTNNPKLVKQLSQNISQEIQEIFNELTIIFENFILTAIPRPFIILVGIVLSLYYRWDSVYEYIKKNGFFKRPESQQPLFSENTPLIPVALKMGENQEEFIEVVEVKNHYGVKEKEKPSPAATGFPFVEIIRHAFWIIVGATAVTVTMLLLQMSYGSIVFCLLWMWCIWKPKKTCKENTPPNPVKDTSNENVTHNRGENKEESSERAHGSTEVHVEQNTLASAGKIEGTEDTTDHVSDESKISK